ncbi:hypothetical protein BH23ACT9_BH23ACT9_34770 [soil metagenome]
MPTTPPSNGPGPKAGDPAPALDLPDLDGQRWCLADQRGAGVIVSFLRHAG